MANLGGPFDLIRNIYGGRDTWRLKVRVVRVWEICARDNPANVFSIEMVLVDSEGGRIQASIRKAMLRKYMNYVAEGCVYKMTYFAVVDNGGSYRATSHDFKLLFQARTRVIPAENVIGLATAVGEEKHHEKGYAKVKNFLGVVSINTMHNSTRLLWNPQIPEAISFKNGIIEHGYDTTLPLGVIGKNDCTYPLREEFICLFPRKTIEDLQLTEEEGIFICLGKVEGIITDGAWWYSSCKCLKAVNLGDDGEGYYCTGCEANKCAEMLAELKEPTSYEYPEQLNIIIGKEILFKVEVKDDRAFSFDDSFKVKKLCDDEGIVNEFKEERYVQTPEMSKVDASFLDICDDGKSDDGKSVDGQINCVPLEDSFNDSSLSHVSLGECSNAAACLAPEKRKAVGRVGVTPLSKKRGRGNVVKMEK
ncbi:Nucleic acid-binding, OB-fold [Sesbania bispinosa]|nr:Nucleic acid-binding, OB-fold [Sesbania bispinosa]